MIKPHIPQKVCVDQYAVEVGARDWQTNPLVGADRNQNGIKALLEKLIEIVNLGV